MQKWTKRTQKGRSRHEMTRSGCLEDRSMKSSGLNHTQVIDLKRSSHTNGNPNGTHLGFMQKWKWWTQKSTLGQGVTRSGCLKDISAKIEWVQAYLTDRSKDLATHPRRAAPPKEISARSQGKCSQNYMKFEM